MFIAIKDENCKLASVRRKTGKNVFLCINLLYITPFLYVTWLYIIVLLYIWTWSSSTLHIWIWYLILQIYYLTFPYQMWQLLFLTTTNAFLEHREEAATGTCCMSKEVWAINQTNKFLNGNKSLFFAYLIKLCPQMFLLAWSSWKERESALVSICWKLIICRKLSSRGTWQTRVLLSSTSSTEYICTEASSRPASAWRLWYCNKGKRVKICDRANNCQNGLDILLQDNCPVYSYKETFNFWTGHAIEVRNLRLVICWPITRRSWW